MNHFVKIASGIDVAPLLLALQQQPRLWNQVPDRTGNPQSPHFGSDDILLRYNCSYTDHRECCVFPAWAHLPQAHGLTFALMTYLQGTRLGRVIITRIHPGDTIPAHADIGKLPLHYDTVRYYNRYHLCLQASPGTWFRVEDERVEMQPGDIWWFDNALEHEVHNPGPAERLHMIIDINTESAAYATD